MHTLLSRSSQDDGEIEQLSDGGVSNDALLISDRVKIADGIVQAVLQINNKKHLYFVRWNEFKGTSLTYSLVLVEPLIRIL